MCIGYSTNISLILGFSIKQNRLCDLFPGTELFIIALALCSQVATAFIQPLVQPTARC